ncbi:DNA repair protein RadB, partial [Candidatus Woesearchaeota archaeon]|nr:DNA repair protein RadB [Candidatus Woesearchaeota archaeon]
LQKLKNGRVFVLKKHRSMPEGKEIKFKIVREGLQKLD